MSALSVPHVRLERIMREWQAAERDRRLLAPFRSSKLAIPDAADRCALDAADLGRCAVGEPAPAPGEPFASARPVYVGIDTGDWCHLAAMTSGTDKLNYVYFDRVPGEALLARLAALAENAPIAGILIDQRPEGALARAVCRAYPGIARLQTFAAGERKSEKRFAGDSFGVMAFEREETLGAWCDLVRRGDVIFPRTMGGTAFAASDVARHILAGAARIETTDAAGGTVLRFRTGAVENHWLMACVFAARVAGERGVAIRASEIGLVGERAIGTE